MAIDRVGKVYLMDTENNCPVFFDNGTIYEADSRDSKGVEAQLGLVYDRDTCRFVDDNEDSPLSREEFEMILGDRAYDNLVDERLLGEW